MTCRVLLEVRARDADALGSAVIQHDLDRSTADDLQFVPTDLIALRQIRIAGLGGQDGPSRHTGVDRQPELDRHAYRFGVEHRQHARIGEIDQIGLRVSGAPGSRGTEKIFDRGVDRFPAWYPRPMTVSQVSS